ncbi:uncharacterized protein LOC127706854 [Mytilus californianus]|uniref:uncharacterized protein LOC127706854 n=1 Tax=Mytilus californianus TaxID=6549 RepID=UPI002247E56F|nr:uncharacterized protein LOC127706854 [Mytilus californianus]XP_052067536.1 uncharacterized protein LOC127706854 [Mytilus californianus]
MISAVSELIVEDLGSYSLNRVHGIIESNLIKPMSVVVEKTPVRRKFWADNQYIVYNYLISDLLSGDSDGFANIPIETKNFVNYCKAKEISCGVSGKLSLEVFNKLPHLKADAKASGGILIKIKEGGLKLSTLKETEFERQLKGRSVKKDHDFLTSFFDKPRRRICVVTSILETADKTVIECCSKSRAHGSVSAEVVGQGANVQAEGSSTAFGTLTLEPGTVLACNWKILKLDRETGEIGLDYPLSAPKNKKCTVIANSTAADFIDGDDKSMDCELPELFDLKSASEDERHKFKTAITAIKKCSRDIDELMKMFENKIANTKTLQEKVKHSEAVFSLLSLAGYTVEGKYIKKTRDTTIETAVEAVVEALDTFNRADVECITNCNQYQKEGFLNIIKRAMKGETVIQIDTKFVEELQKKPVEHVLAVLNFEIDPRSSSVITPSKNVCSLKGMCYLFAYL